MFEEYTLMRNYLALCFLTLSALWPLHSEPVAAAAPAGPIIKHLSSLLRLTIPSASKSTPSDGNVLQFESGYLVETVVEGSALGVLPYSIRVSQDGELFAVDADNNNIVRITPPLSQYSRARLVAGSFQGKAGHVDGKPSDARFGSPRGVAMDDKGNVYVADTTNLAIRKIGETGVSTIAGGKSNVAGFRDGPSEDAQFSADFDLVYVRPTCSLLVVDRGNAALRQISLNQEDCDYHYSSISVADVIMVVGAILVGYVSCIVQQGLGPSFLSRLLHPSETTFQEHNNDKLTTLRGESMKEEAVTGWPSLGQLISYLSKLVPEFVGNIFHVKYAGPTKRGLHPVKDTLEMPEDEAVKPQPSKKHIAPPPTVSETRQTYLPLQNPPVDNKYAAAEMKPPKIRSTSSKDPTKLRSSKRRECTAEFYGSGEAPSMSSQARPKGHKERSKHHRHREKSGEVGYGVQGIEQPPKYGPGDVRTMNYGEPKFDPYNMRPKYGPGDAYRF